MKSSSVYKLHFDDNGLSLYFDPAMTTQKSFKIFKAFGFILLVALGIYFYFSASPDVLPYKSKAYSSSQDLRLFVERRHAPSFQWELTNRRTTRLRDYTGQVVYINFWAKWCPPCLKEIPYLSKLQQDFKDQGLQILFVNMDEADSWKEIKLEFESKYPTAKFIFGQNQIFTSKAPVERLPYHLIVDKKGQVAAEFYGDILEQKQKIEVMLLELLQESLDSFD